MALKVPMDVIRAMVNNSVDECKAKRCLSADESWRLRITSAEQARFEGPKLNLKLLMLCDFSK
ncbi:hypothetical protein A2533_01425 [Candidatus Falkowbacteria bacterium RIFOXYD2_FULL_35_9]|uniref:Uncharacterized protein n=1 Tax=Candidatus Falkowbacteria bacterium RIFOXYC2_FULL_36_12 TaxID=1798002 RepID=A0A1F5T0T1_9BACT|nr:MAG: hypothetical protein A2300_03425 [Candidatus Falkowbacteria bacterium RIFOXYB2_FULL_35_7]OGF32346.1 MAG: hypothetical protein A2478_03420 [Candidatus Falkowbacteria bacterium RIFOXYC2_FULL_36_12]OGF33241.1 MAG: hypothetical protein A2223_03900 [Candidatus Falkowbacteria bacterium RIFOXYA2_FULL_35_8]OGF47264.1 MAG: hypothetical protein A2533_01425 [Candidatus Falkowbacteria bacterium RIFOXYD2_FULL_35_9]